MGRLSRGDERALRRREEDDPRRRAGVPRAVRAALVFLLPTNLYGPHDNFHATNAHVIPDLIRKMLASPEEVVLWGDGSPTREFLYVDDCAEGLVLAADRYDDAGSGEPRREQGDLDPRARGADRRRDRASAGGSNGTRRSRTASRGGASTGHAREELFGFEAKTPLREGLERTVAWYREHAPAYAPS